MTTINVLDNAIAEIKHNIHNEEQVVSISQAKIDAWELVLFDLNNYRQAEINRANNGPAPADVHHDLYKVYKS